MTVAVEVADILFFLGVEADDRVASRLKFSFEFSNLGKLLQNIRQYRKLTLKINQF